MNIELLKARMKQFFADVDPDALIKKYEEMGYKLVPIADETPSEPDSEAVEFAEWIGKQGYKLSHYAAKGEAVYLHESKGKVLNRNEQNA